MLHFRGSTVGLTWYDRMDRLLMTLGFIESKVDSNLCLKVEGGRPVMLLLCVVTLFSRYGGVAEYRWSLPWSREVYSRDPEEVWDDGLQGNSHTMESNLKLLCDASSESVDATIYRQMIASLMYLTNTRPNICFVVNTLSQFLTDPRHVHLIAAKHIRRYLKGTVDYGLKYNANRSSMMRIRRLT